METEKFIKKRERDNPTLGLKFVYASNTTGNDYSTATSLWFRSAMNHIWIFHQAKGYWGLATVLDRNEMKDLIKVFKELMK